MKKPRLFIDIDGVLYGYYGGEWQFRPYIVTLTKWAEKHFDVYYLSFNSRREMVVSAAYAPGTVITDWKLDKLDENGNIIRDDRGFPSQDARDWHPKAGSSEKLHAIREYGGLEDPWILIEDTPPHKDQIEILEDYKCLDRWLVVPDTGADVLLDVKIALEGWLQHGKLEVSHAWCNPTHVEKDLCCTAVWLGHGINPRTGKRDD